MKNIKQILDEVLKDVHPDKAYEKEIFERINKIIKKINKGHKHIKAILGGSGAKGTWLKTFDADIFVLFNYGTFKDKSAQLSDILEKILKRKFKKITRLHGSRDYFQVKDSRFTFEIIPVLKIRKAEQAKNITDASPLHSNWVKKHKKLIDEVKLTKQFCQAQDVYGAESYLKGFSGYVCEILTVYYGSFLNLVKNAAKWNDKIVIDAHKYYKGKDIFKLVNTSKLISPLIVIDPVQKDRNAAAALSIERFEKFKNSTKEFLKFPSKEFFTKKNKGAVFLPEKSKNKKLIIFKVRPLSGKIDVVGSKLLKTYEFFRKNFQNFGFENFSSDWEWDKKNDAVFYFLFCKTKLSRTVEVEGPPLRMTAHADHFKKLHKKTFIRDGRIIAVEQRKFSEPELLLRSIIKNPFVIEKSKSIKADVS